MVNLDKYMKVAYTHTTDKYVLTLFRSRYACIQVRLKQ